MIIIWEVVTYIEAFSAATEREYSKSVLSGVENSDQIFCGHAMSTSVLPAMKLD